MAFLDLRFPDGISLGAVGGPGYSTDVVVINSGFEQRNANWATARNNYDVAHAARTRTQMEALIAFFRIAQGRAHSFRFKDWMDFKCLLANGLLGLTGIGNGAPAYQLYKQYSNSAGSEKRKITRPLSGSVTVYRNGSPVTVGAAPGNISINHGSGLVTFVPDSTKAVNANVARNITAITQANPGVVTATAHGFVSGDRIRIASVVGMTQVNNLYFTITVIDANSFSIGVNSTTYTAYASGGTATKRGITQTNPVRVYASAHGLTNGRLVHISGASGMTQVNGNTYTVANAGTDFFDLSAIDGTAFGLYTGAATLGNYAQPADTLTWAGEFDVPCRFDVDQLRGEILAKDVFGWGQIPIVEVRE